MSFENHTPSSLKDLAKITLGLLQLSSFLQNSMTLGMKQSPMAAMTPRLPNIEPSLMI